MPQKYQSLDFLPTSCNHCSTLSLNTLTCWHPQKEFVDASSTKKVSMSQPRKREKLQFSSRKIWISTKNMSQRLYWTLRIRRRMIKVHNHYLKTGDPPSMGPVLKLRSKTIPCHRSTVPIYGFLASRFKDLRGSIF